MEYPSMNKKNEQPGINFDNIILKDLNFHLEPNCPMQPKINVNFSSNFNFDKTHNILAVELALEIIEREEKPRIKLKCSFIGFFSNQKDGNDIDFNKFAQFSAPPIMFPFIRETVTSITAKSAITPIILPPINIIAILNPPPKSKKVDKK